MKMKQPKHAPTIKEDMTMQHTLRVHTTLTWCTVTIMNVSNGKNMQNGTMFFRKWGAAEVRWHANNFTENEERVTVVEMQKKQV